MTSSNGEIRLATTMTSPILTSRYWGRFCRDRRNTEKTEVWQPGNGDLSSILSNQPDDIPIAIGGGNKPGSTGGRIGECRRQIETVRASGVVRAGIEQQRLAIEWQLDPTIN